jgi:hypothetical protein
LACLLVFFPSTSSSASSLVSSHLPCAWRDHTTLVYFFLYRILCRLLLVVLDMDWSVQYHIFMPFDLCYKQTPYAFVLITYVHVNITVLTQISEHHYVQLHNTKACKTLVKCKYGKFKYWYVLLSLKIYDEFSLCSGSFCITLLCLKSNSLIFLNTYTKIKHVFFNCINTPNLKSQIYT